MFNSPPPPTPPDPPHRSSNPLPRLIHSALSYDGNVMLAALISLLLVILFVLLLHIYAKWFLAQARHRRTRSVSVSGVFGAPARFHHFHTFTLNTTTLSSSPKKGLQPSVISSLPLFVYKSGDHKHGLECVICLSVFEDEEMGKKLPKCSHAFHVDCIDMWLHSHSNCPICRAPVVAAREMGKTDSIANDNGILREEQTAGMASTESGLVNGESALEIVVEVPNSENENLGMNDSLSVTSTSSSLSSQASSLGGSLRMMMSRNRSERKVHPSSNVNGSS
ncbi:RING-H2 finger protein ATL63 [Cornus florida]|uniref:RING-H2 finger protein ATL63 n=1 Tax=Cornus florida TaxID=4283 RepID=UPI00289CD1E0|nr:RING-H2 finger protein ATL63 [Cornus florida]